jgi:hypothetical protein
MTDEREQSGMQPGGYDDDRLLACALGLDDDPELLAAATDDAELGARLEAMRAEVAGIGAQVSAAVPAPGDDYTDLSGDRWSGLKEYFEPPADARPRSERRWWRVVAPVAALLVLALVVGIVAINGGSGTGSSGSPAEVARSGDDSAAAPAQSLEGGGSTKSGVTTIRETFTEQLDRFAVVVLARARQATGAVQRFVVLRVFKGSAPKVVELAVNGRPTDEGRLHLLLLDPTAPPEADTATPGAAPASPEALLESPVAVPESPAAPTGSPEPGLSPEPIPSIMAAQGALDGPGEPLAVAYTYHGEPTMVREFPAGTDPGTISLRIP